MFAPRSKLLLYVVLLALAMPLPARAQQCLRSCPRGTPRDAHGCCLVSKKKTAPRPPTAGPRRGRCRVGMVTVAGHCCWPGQDWGAASKKCIGKPRCPAGMAITRGGQGCEADPGRVRWISMPAGSYSMGVKGSKWSGPPRTVKLARFSISQTEVTTAQYGRCVKKKACSVPGGGRTHCTWGKKNAKNHPVNCVSWQQARAYCVWVGGKLPTEAQWEYAARGGGKKQKYPWGDDAASCDRVVMSGAAAACANKKPKGPAPVCSRPSGNTAQGLCDMAGNLNEWIRDWHARPYSTLDLDNPEGPTGGKTRVVRGGDWMTGTHRYFEVTFRKSIIPTLHWDWLGFRCVKQGR